MGDEKKSAVRTPERVLGVGASGDIDHPERVGPPPAKTATAAVVAPVEVVVEEAP